MNGPDERLSLSDHSDKYSHIFMYGNENGDILSGKIRPLHQGTTINVLGYVKYLTEPYIWLGFQVYPPPTTPPEPAPPDHPFSSIRTSKRVPMLSASQTSLDEITCKCCICSL